jgi:hypothetical protein
MVLDQRKTQTGDLIRQGWIQLLSSKRLPWLGQGGFE